MRSATDPLHTWRQRLRLIWITGLPLIAITILWAIRTPNIDTAEASSIGASTTPATSDAPTPAAASGFPAAQAFAATLWFVPPPPEPVVTTADPTPPPPPTPPPLSLLATLRTGIDGEWIAVLYDTSTKSVIRCRAGDTFGPFTVSTISKAGATFLYQDRMISIELRKPAK